MSKAQKQTEPSTVENLELRAANNEETKSETVTFHMPELLEKVNPEYRELAASFLEKGLNPEGGATLNLFGIINPEGVKTLNPQLQKLIKEVFKYLLFEKFVGDAIGLEVWFNTVNKKLNEIPNNLPLTEKNGKIKELLAQDQLFFDINQKFQNPNLENKSEPTPSAQTLFAEAVFLDYCGEYEESVAAYNAAHQAIKAENPQNDTEKFIKNNVINSIYYKILNLHLKHNHNAALVYYKNMHKEIGEVQNELGLAYYLGLGVEQNDQQAEKYFYFAAIQLNSSKAEHNLHMLNQNRERNLELIAPGNLLQPNGSTFQEEKAEFDDRTIKSSWLGPKTMTENEALFANNQLTILIYDVQIKLYSYESSDQVEAYKATMKDKVGNAYNELGYAYSIGCGVEENHEEAFKNFRLAAEMGYVPAQLNLGIMHYEEKNPQEAARCFAIVNDAQSNYFLCLMNYGGIGVPQNFAEGRILAASAQKYAIEQGKEEFLIRVENIAKQKNVVKTINGLPKFGQTVTLLQKLVKEAEEIDKSHPERIVNLENQTLVSLYNKTIHNLLDKCDEYCGQQTEKFKGDIRYKGFKEIRDKLRPSSAPNASHSASLLGQTAKEKVGAVIR